MNNELKNKAYDIHFIPFNKKRTITVQVIFRDVARKKDVSYKHLLVKLLGGSTKKYHNGRLFRLEKMNLYNVNTQIDTTTIGNTNLFTFEVEFLSEKYTEEGMDEKSINLLLDMIFDPNSKKDEFDEKAFRFAKAELIEEIENEKDLKRAYATRKMLEAMDSEAPYAFSKLANKDEVIKITNKDLYEFYKNMLKTHTVDIYVVGMIDKDKVNKIIEERFLINTIKKENINTIYTPTKFRKKVQNIVLKDDINQSTLVIGGKFKDLTFDEREYVLSVYNLILGSGTNSKFFTILREKNSLCYFAYETIMRYDNIFLICVGINSSVKDKVIKLIKKLRSDMVAGDFSDEDIDIAKQVILSTMKEMEDNPNSLIKLDYYNKIAGTEDLETRKEKIKNVSKKEIMEVAKKGYLDTIYLLEGGSEDEDV